MMMMMMIVWLPVKTLCTRRGLDWGDGDMMTMEGMTQKHFQHRVPKEASGKGGMVEFGASGGRNRNAETEGFDENFHNFDNFIQTKWNLCGLIAFWLLSRDFLKTDFEWSPRKTSRSPAMQGYVDGPRINLTWRWTVTWFKGLQWKLADQWIINIKTRPLQVFTDRTEVRSVWQFLSLSSLMCSVFKLFD